MGIFKKCKTSSKQKSNNRNSKNRQQQQQPQQTQSTSSQISQTSSYTNNNNNTNNARRKSFFSLISPSEVTEGSLEVWRHLPQKIRQDPSLASFQQEHERLHGGIQDEGFDDISPFGDREDDYEEDRSEFITIKITNAQGDREIIEDVCTYQGPQNQQQQQQQTDNQYGNNTIQSINDESKTFSIDHSLDDHHDTIHNVNKYKKKGRFWFFLFTWIIATALLTYCKEKQIRYKQVAIPLGKVKNYILPELPYNNRLTLLVEGPFATEQQNTTTNNNLHINYVYLNLQHLLINFNNNTTDDDKDVIETYADVWKIPIVEPVQMDDATLIKKRRLYYFDENNKSLNQERSILRVKLWTNKEYSSEFALKIGYDASPMNINIGMIYGALILIALYVLIIWEIVHRTFAAILASTMSIAVLAALNDRPTMREIVTWIDSETLLLLFSMMILIAILTETGIFDYLAVYTFKITNGKVWPLIHCLCIITTLMSSFLDNVTTVLIMTPISIRLCEVMELNPVSVLMAIIVHANIGGTITPIGDPPSVIITSNHFISKHGVTFLNFTLHMGLGILIVVVQTMLQLRYNFRNINDLRIKEPKELQELRREITVWERAAASISSFSKDADLVRETLTKKVKILHHQLKKKLAKGVVSTDRYRRTLEELQSQYPIKNKKLLIKAGIALAFIFIMFIIESFPQYQRLSLGWSALIGVILLLSISGRDDMDALMSRIEWTTLLFFAAMFVLMEALTRLGLIAGIGKITETLILSVPEECRLALAIIILLWVSAITSAFVDSIPVTTMMVKIVVSLAENTSLGLPLQPLVWALAFGPCLGGNGTLIGASANIVCAGIAEQHGYKISFIEYFKVGFPIMIGSVVVTTGYLIVAHVLFSWH